MHVQAASVRDLYFAWGYVTARDRLWQIVETRRSAQGRMWEWIGNRALRDDGGAQLFRLRERAAAIWARDREIPDVREAVERYTAGVNAYMSLCRHGIRPWPPELLRLGKTPDPWEPQDAHLVLLAQGMLLDLALPEIAEARTLRREGLDMFRRRHAFEAEWTWDTIPDSVVTPGSTTTAGTIANPGSIQIAAAPPCVVPPDLLARARLSLGRWLSPATDDPDARASNVFAVGPDRSASGRPLLANDPHLPLTNPNPLHVVHLTVPGVLDAAGAAVPGMPMIVSGRNHDVAWGLTALSADVMDVYADTLSRDGHSVRWNGGWTALREEPFTMRYSVLGFFDIPVPGRKRVYDPHGPVVVMDRGRGIALSVHWAGSDSSITLESLLGIERSRSAAEVAARVRTLVTPCMNFVAADVSGHVIYQAAGAVPRRGFDPGPGLLPGDGKHEWAGLIPPDQMPAWDVPGDGFVVNCNNTPVGPDKALDAWPRFDWAHDRARRITSLLAASPREDEKSLAAIQNDVHSLDAGRALPLLLRCADSLSAPLNDREHAALALLRRWDRDARRDQVGATLYWSWYRVFQRRSKLDGLTGFTVAALDGRAAWALHSTQSGRPERAAEAVVAALRIAIGQLSRRFGHDMDRWRWGPAHEATFRHALSSVYRSYDPPHVAIDGDRSTPSVGGSRMPWSIKVTHGPVFRHVVDLAVPDSSLAIIALGNSGDPSSGHALDQLAPWADHAYVPLFLSWTRVEQVKERETRLEPSP